MKLVKFFDTKDSTDIVLLILFCRTKLKMIRKDERDTALQLSEITKPIFNRYMGMDKNKSLKIKAKPSI